VAELGRLRQFDQRVLEAMITLEAVAKITDSIQHGTEIGLLALCVRFFGRAE